MIVHACIYLLAGGALSGFLFGIGWVLTLLLQGEPIAAQFTTAWLSTFSGILVGASGYGLLFFVTRERHRIGPALLNVFDVPTEYQPEFTHRLSTIQNWSLRGYVTALLTLIGGIVLVRAGIPLNGFAHWYLTAAVISYYLIGAYMLMIFVAILSLFAYVDDHASPAAAHRLSLRVPLRSIEIKTIDAYLIISSLLGLLAIYHAFRTTLTAFAGAPRPYYELMILPLFFFVPATLVFSFYPRYVLREVWDSDTYMKLEQLERLVPDSLLDGDGDPKARLELRKLLIEIKAKVAEERKSVPLLTLKDAPTLTLAAFTVIQFVVQKDPVLVNFFKSIFKL